MCQNNSSVIVCQKDSGIWRFTVSTKMKSSLLQVQQDNQFYLFNATTRSDLHKKAMQIQCLPPYGGYPGKKIREGNRIKMNALRMRLAPSL